MAVVMIHTRDNGKTPLFQPARCLLFLYHPSSALLIRPGHFLPDFFTNALDQPGQCLASMADPILLAHRKLRRGLAQIGQVEIRIVAESALAARIELDFPLPCSIGNDRLGILRAAHQHHYAVIVRLAIRLAFKRIDQFLIVAFVGSGFARIAGRKNTRVSSQRIHANAGIIRQCRQSENSYPLGQRARCEVVASYDNQCMALAKDPSDDGTAWGWGSNDYQADADSRALSECRANAGGRANRCRITMRHCDGSAASGK